MTVRATVMGPAREREIPVSNANELMKEKMRKQAEPPKEKERLPALPRDPSSGTSVITRMMEKQARLEGGERKPRSPHGTRQTMELRIAELERQVAELINRKPCVCKQQETDHE